MQFNVLQWQGFHMYRCFYIDHASPSQCTQGKSTVYATCCHQTQEGAPMPWYWPCNMCTSHCGWHEAVAPASCPPKHPRASLTHKLIQTGACKGPHFSAIPVMQASLEPPDFLVSRSDLSSVQDCIQDRVSVVPFTRNGWDPIQFILQGP